MSNSPISSPLAGVYPISHIRGSAALICGTGINAHSLLHTLRRVGWTGRVELMRPASEPRGFAEIVNPDVPCWTPKLTSIDEFPGLIEQRFGQEGPVYVFFTDERFHPAFAAWLRVHPDSPIRCFLGSTTHMTAVLDRYEFCRFIKDRNLAPVPKTITGEEDPFEAFGDNFVLRTRTSWYSVTQRERVKLVEGRAHHAKLLKAFAERGLNAEHLSYQELLSIRDEDNVSICGWYGPEHRHVYCTHKLLQWPPKTGGGDVVERMVAPNGIQVQAEAILAALEYDGPFEMEFVYDENSREYKVTELNPRFWLQHGLIEQISGNALASRYLGLEPQPTANDQQPVSPIPYPVSAAKLPSTWVNPLYSVFRLTRLDTRNLRKWISKKSWSPMTLREALRYGLSYCRFAADKR